jgi:hypothetical protein
MVRRRGDWLLGSLWYDIARHVFLHGCIIRVLIHAML